MQANNIAVSNIGSPPPQGVYLVTMSEELGVKGIDVRLISKRSIQADCKLFSMLVDTECPRGSAARIYKHKYAHDSPSQQSGLRSAAYNLGNDEK